MFLQSLAEVEQNFKTLKKKGGRGVWCKKVEFEKEKEILGK